MNESVPVTWKFQFDNDHRREWSIVAPLKFSAAREVLRETLARLNFDLQPTALAETFVVRGKNTDLDTVTLLDLDGERTRITYENRPFDKDYWLGSSDERVIQVAREYASALQTVGSITDRDFAEFMLDLKANLDAVHARS